MTTPIRAALERLVAAVKPKYTDFEEIVEVASAVLAARAALKTEPEGSTNPSGYAYRYHDYTGGTYIKFNGGGEVNGSRPIEAVPYWFAPPSVPTTPSTPEPGEVGELVELLKLAGRWATSTGVQLDRFAALLDDQEAELAALRGVAMPVSERLPKPNTKVLAHYCNESGKGRTICAIWVPAKTRASDSDIDEDLEFVYDHETDQFYWPEGWYEAIENWEEFGYLKVYEGKVAYWQPLPKWPANATPLPAPQAGEAQS